MTAPPNQPEQQEQWVLAYESTGLFVVDLREIRLVRVAEPERDQLDHQVEEAKRDPSNVYRVDAYPGVVQACRIALECFGDEEGEIAAGALADIRDALAAVHPAKGDKE